MSKQSLYESKDRYIDISLYIDSITIDIDIVRWVCADVPTNLCSNMVPLFQQPQDDYVGGQCQVCQGHPRQQVPEDWLGCPRGIFLKK